MDLGASTKAQKANGGALEHVAAFALRVLERLGRASSRVSVLAEVVRVKVAPVGVLADNVDPDRDAVDDWRFLRRPALLGFVALTCIGVGVSFPSSPFKLEMPGTWFFGVPATQGATSTSYLLFGLVAVYGGLVLLMRVWYGMTKALTRRPGTPIKHLWWIFALWTIPMLVIAPIFSRDVFSYAAQGEMVSHHINPYNYGPAALGAGPYVNPVDSLWANSPAPYGPLFLIIDGFFASASLHHVLVTVILLRLLSVGGVVAIAWCIPKLARAYGREPGPVFVLAVLNPLVLLTLIGAAHNDAIMLGLLVCGITAAKLKHPVAGVVLCALAAGIKVPAALGIVYIGWDWLGTGVPWRQRVRPVVTAGLIALAVLAALSVLSGLGWGWVANLETPGTVRSWLAPTTALGLGLSGVLHSLGVGLSTTSVLSGCRLLGFAGAAGYGIYLLKASDRLGWLKALSFTLLAFVLLGPVVQPWYLTWGLVMLAPIAVGRTRTLIVGVSVLSPFIGLPGGRTLLDQLIHADPLSVAFSFVVLLGVLLVPIGRWSTSWRWEASPDDLWGDDDDFELESARA
ncbi:MAG: polyprenol phosphomannose-dependent alpha 1,6 mannosyltransferase MptB [Acidimicrobiales bacterium]